MATPPPETIGDTLIPVINKLQDIFSQVKLIEQTFTSVPAAWTRTPAADHAQLIAPPRGPTIHVVFVDTWNLISVAKNSALRMACRRPCSLSCTAKHLASRQHTTDLLSRAHTAGVAGLHSQSSASRRCREPKQRQVQRARSLGEAARCHKYIPVTSTGYGLST
jgi:hypothetical protein